MAASGLLETACQPQACRALEILNAPRSSASVDEQMRNFQQKCEDAVQACRALEILNATNSGASDDEQMTNFQQKCEDAVEDAAKLRTEFGEIMRQRLAALEQAEHEALTRARQNQQDLERRMAEWHQEATCQVDESARKQNVRAQQLCAEELRLDRLKQMVNEERDMPLKDRNQQNDLLASEDANSPGVQRCAKEAANLEAGQEKLKDKLKSVEEKHALSQKAIADAEAATAETTERLASLDQDAEEARRKQDQQSKAILKKENWETANKAKLAKLNAKNQLNVLQEITSLRSKNKASASAQRLAHKLEAELRNLKEEHEKLQAEMNSSRNTGPVDLGTLCFRGRKFEMVIGSDARAPCGKTTMQCSFLLTAKRKYHREGGCVNNNHCGSGSEFRVGELEAWASISHSTP